MSGENQRAASLLKQFLGNGGDRTTIPTEYVCVVIGLLEANKQQEAEPGSWQYFHFDRACPSASAKNSNCICWHDEGTGPMENEKHSVSSTVEWRESPKPSAQPQVTEGIVEKYSELLYHVARKLPNESRHQTALRYIKNAESGEVRCSAAKEEGK